MEAAVGHDLDQRLLVANTDHSSDKAISRWCYAGMAAHRLQCPGITGYRVGMSMDSEPVQNKTDEYCLVDFSWLSGFEVREGFETYGATAFFDKERKLTKIHWSHGDKTVTPKDSEWAHAKWAFKVSVLLGVTLRDHLADVHHIVSEQLVIASREALGKNHPLRRLTKPFTYGTADINSASTKTLVVENSLVHRATALTWGAVQKAFSILLVRDRYLPSAEKYLAHMGTAKLPTGNFPLGEDWLAFDKTVQKFVSDYVNLYYTDDKAVQDDAEVQDFWKALHLPDPKLAEAEARLRVSAESKSPDSFMRDKVTSKDRLVNVLTSFIVGVTGIHNQVGNIGEYIVNPSYAGGKIRPGATMSDVQGSFQVLNIGLATAAKRPMLLDNVDHLLLDQGAKDVWKSFHTELRALAARIDKLNEGRGIYKCNAMNPKKMLYSVSI